MSLPMFLSLDFPSFSGLKKREVFFHHYKFTGHLHVLVEYGVTWEGGDIARYESFENLSSAVYFETHMGME